MDQLLKGFIVHSYKITARWTLLPGVVLVLVGFPLASFLLFCFVFVM